MRRLGVICIFLWNLKLSIGGCPTDSSNLISICQPAAVFDQTRYTMEFAGFENSTESSCQCSIVAPTAGEFSMAPIPFPNIQGCNTRITVSVTNRLVSSTSTECFPAPLVMSSLQAGDIIQVEITTLDTTRKAEYCYSASYKNTKSFTQNINFTCNAVTPGTTTSLPTTTISTTTTSATTTAKATPSVVVTSPRVAMSSTAKQGTPQTKPSTDKEEVPLPIVIPAAVGGLLVIVVIVVVAVVCSRRSKNSNNTEKRGNENPNFNMEEQENDGLRDNILYKSADNGGYSEIGDGHYSSVIRRSGEIKDTAKNAGQPSSGQNNSPSENNTAAGPVYAVVDKNKSQNKKQGPPVSEKPSKNSQVLETEGTNVPVYAVPDKSQTKKGRSGDYDTPPNNRPITPPAQSVRTSNKDGLLYSEVEHTGIGPIPDLPKRKSDSTEQEGVTYSDIRTEL